MPVAPNTGDSLWASVEQLRNKLNSSRATHVNSGQTRALAKQIVQDYFRQVRPEVLQLRVDTASVDRSMQELLHLSNGRNRRRSYLRTIRQLAMARRELEAQRELRLGEVATGHLRATRKVQGIEAQILETLRKLRPSAALSYEQAIVDLWDEGRLSFRGTAVELREALREVLDHLAPDRTVTESEGFVLQQGRTAPTMRQKVRFILRSRDLPRGAMTAPEDSVSLVEEHTASLARSTYERGSISTHIGTTKQEARQLKMYVDSVLAELLEIHR